jgi:hypothetical protein
MVVNLEVDPVDKFSRRSHGNRLRQAGGQQAKPKIPHPHDVPPMESGLFLWWLCR